MKKEIFYQTEMHFSNGESAVIEYIEHFTHEFCMSTLEEVSKRTLYSISGISKLSKKLGFKSFKLMQMWVQKENNYFDKDQWMDSPEKTKDILRNVKITYERGMKRTLSDISFKNLDMAIEVIKSKKHLMTFGIGSSKLAAIELAESLNILGYSCSYIRTIHDVFLNLNNQVKKERAIILFSKSISSHELKVLREVLKNGKVNLIVVTANQNTEIYENEIHVHFRTFEQNNRVIAQSSKISQILIADTLINSLKEIKENDIYENFNYEWRY